MSPFRDVTSSMEEAQNRAIISLTGLEKTYKTSFCFTAPKPIWYINMDFAYRPALERALEQGVITLDQLHVADHFVSEDAGIAPPLPDPDDFPSEAEYERQCKAFSTKMNKRYRELADVMSSVRSDFRAAIEEADEVGGTVVVDPATRWWQLVTAVNNWEAYVIRARRWKKDRGELTEDRRDFGRANTYMEGVLSRPLIYDRVNCIYVQRATNVYDERGGKTADIDPVGFKYTPAIVDATVKLSFKGKQHVANIESARRSGLLRGAEILEPEWDTVAARIIAGK